jgi:predicted MFS family arabinose efflux permease
MAGEKDLINAISLNSAVFNAARVMGPAVAGLVVAAVGEGVCFLLNGISFLAVIACLLAMRIAPFEPKEISSPFRHVVDGFRYAWRHSAVRRVLLLMAAFTFAGMPVFVLMPVFAEAIFHEGSRGLGFLTGGMGLGAVAGTLVLARRTRTTGLPQIIAYNGLVIGATYLMFALSRNYYLSLAIMPLVGYSVMRQMASANTTIQTQIPDEYRGRIMALYSMTIVGLGPFGSLAAGAVADRFGARIAVAAGGVLAMAAAAVFGSSLRRNPIGA